MIETAKEFFNLNKRATYAIWGITQKADMICSFLEKKYPESKLMVVQDRSKKILFHGVESTNEPSLLKGVDYVFVTAGTANEDAKKYFCDNNIRNYNISTDGIGE